MSEIAELRNELMEVRREMNTRFDELTRWQSDTDIGMKGIDEHNVWGYKQKIAHNKHKIEEHATRLTESEKKIAKIYTLAVGGGAVAGVVGSVVLALIQTLFSG